jgi:hypothetical protein
VLQRGRTYDQIAAMLSIDRAAVRDRALAAFDAIGPQTRVPPERRALITDYLLGQLPPAVADQVYERLAGSPSERAWARIMSSELAPLAKDQLPEIPSAAARQTTPSAPAEPVSAPAVAAGAPDDDPGREPESPERPPSSRRGGAVVIAGGAIVAIAIIVVAIIIATSGGSNNSSSTPPAAAATTPATTGSTTPTTSTSTTPATGTSTTATQVVAQLTLTTPNGAKTPTGRAEIVKDGAQEGIVIVGAGVPANTKHNAYAVWLSNGGSQNHLLGFVNPAVKSDGKLQTAGVLPANAASYKEVLVTVETQPKPKAPGTIVLQGALSLK